MAGALTRRRFVAGTMCTVAAAALWGEDARPAYTRPLGPRVAPASRGSVQARLVAAERPTALPCFGGHRLPMWTFDDDAWLPLLRLELGSRLEVELENRLPRQGETTSIHWHGVRLPNDQDGVPYLVQPPVAPGERFRYAFTPPDAGTFFFHTHCNTVEQLGRGLAGLLIVDGDTTDAYAADTILLLRDWRVAPQGGAFEEFYTPRGAGRAGSYGRVRSVNGQLDPEIRLPASGDCRLRLVNVDPTRVMTIMVEDAEAAVVAVDAIAVSPFPLREWRLGPAMRIDLVLRAPPSGGIARLVDVSPPGRVELARFTGEGVAQQRAPFDPAPLRAGRIPKPDLRGAQRLRFAFSASDPGTGALTTTPAGGGTLGALCSSQQIFWTIGGRAWPSRDHARLPPPLAELRRGGSYVFELKNESPFAHPIHIHGHTFDVLRSNRRPLPPHHADTVLLEPDEEVEVAFVADNPGDWMFHCHVIEHQESGMMGYLRVA